jgi:hypothetical protein
MIDQTLHQLDIIAIMQAKVKSDIRLEKAVQFNLPFFQLQAQILEGTKESLKNDIGDLIRQKTRLQLHDQESLIIPGLFRVTVSEAEIVPSGKRDHSLRIIIEKNSGDREGWEVSRKEGDFINLHKKLKDKFPEVMHDLELPKSGNIFNRNKESEKERKDALEKYLQVCIAFNLIRY